jgi:hypothetical protein
MIIYPDLLSYPSYRVLRQKIGPGALEALFALWVLAERRGADRIAPRQYFEAAVDWRGTPGEFLGALLETGWAKLDEDGFVRVTYLAYLGRADRSVYVYPALYPSGSQLALSK